MTGRVFHTTSKPTNAVFSLQGLMGTGLTNEFKFGYNAADSTQEGRVTAPGFENLIINLSGSVANTGIAGQGATSGLAIPGGLVRVNSQGNGRSAPYDPYSLTFADSLNMVSGNHFVKLGADMRMIRMSTDQLGGITYSYANLSAFLANTPSTIQYFGDLSEPSPFHNGATGLKHPQQEYYVGFAQDEWRVKPTITLELRAALRLLRAAAGERQPDRQVQHRDGQARSRYDAVLPVQEEQLPAASVGHVHAGREDGARRADSASSSDRDRRRTRFSRLKPSASAHR